MSLIIGLEFTSLRIQNLNTRAQRADNQMPRGKFRQRPYTFTCQSLLAMISFPHTVLIARQSSVKTAKPQRAVLRPSDRNYHIRGEMGLFSFKILAASSQRIIAYYTLIIGSEPPVAISILRDGVHVTKLFIFKYRKEIPGIGCPVLVGTNPECTVVVQHQSIQGVFR